MKTADRKKWLRRISLALGVALLTLVVAGLALKYHGEARLESMTDRFVQEVGPIPEVQLTPEGTEQLHESPAQNVLARLREGRAAGDAALAALQLGDRGRALELLGDIAAERDACFGLAARLFTQASERAGVRGRSEPLDMPWSPLP